jgi:hypothetical protein
MTVRDTYNASVVTAVTKRIATLQGAANTAQESINAVGVNVGANPQLGCSDSQIAAIKAANVQYQVTKAKAGHDEHAAIQVAKDLLRSQGDFAPA